MELVLGDCKEKLKELDDNSIDAIVTDPPYGLSFMGKKWDYDVPSVDIWKECLRVLKPGGYLLSFAGTRTQHRMAVNIEDAGFEIRDMIAWVYGSGFPKSLNIGKAVDKLQGNEREVVAEKETKDFSHHKGSMKGKETTLDNKTQTTTITETKGTSEWEGWGTALKPALEPITVARKPLEKGLTIAENCLKWGVGGINIDGCRVGTEEKLGRQASSTTMFGNGKMTKEDVIDNSNAAGGRFPANLIHDGSDEVVGLFPNNKSSDAVRKNSVCPTYWGTNGIYGKGNAHDKIKSQFYLSYGYSDSGSASRFFYCAKASKRERNIGCEGLETSKKFTAGNYSQSPTCKTCDLTLNGTNDHSECSGEVYYKEMESKNTKNYHPTVKPIALMEYLVKLVSREGQVVLDPFMGSGTTGMACKRLDREFIGIEMMPDYMEIAKARIDGVKESKQLEQLNLLKDNK
jgi:site-specific DNA-methyltransferase (adenine-specific)